MSEKDSLFYCFAVEVPPVVDDVVEPPEEMSVNPSSSNVNNQLATALEEQRQEHLQQIQLLQQKLQEQQRINAQQQQQLQQQQQQQIPGIPTMPAMHAMPPVQKELQQAFVVSQQLQVPAESASNISTEAQASNVDPPVMGQQQQQPKFQLQPEVFAQIQALTGDD